MVSQFYCYEQAIDQKEVRGSVAQLWKGMVEQSYLANGGTKKRKNEKEGEGERGRKRWRLGTEYAPKT